MKVISTNIGQSTTVEWKGEKIQTGIYKYPTAKPILLQKEDVVGDSVIDRKHHGGIYKACYLFASDNYAYWKIKYPDLNWDWGMFGENLTVKNLDEAKIRIGNIYKLGDALVQVTQPREPCYKLGIRFNDENIIKQFIEHEKPGTYVRILEEGKVSKGDTLELIEKSENSLTVKQFYQLLNMRKKDINLVKLAVTNTAIPLKKRDKLQKLLY